MYFQGPAQSLTISFDLVSRRFRRSQWGTPEGQSSESLSFPYMLLVDVYREWSGIETSIAYSVVLHLLQFASICLNLLLSGPCIDPSASVFLA